MNQNIVMKYLFSALLLFSLISCEKEKPPIVLDTYSGVAKGLLNGLAFETDALLSKLVVDSEEKFSLYCTSKTSAGAFTSQFICFDFSAVVGTYPIARTVPSDLNNLLPGCYFILYNDDIIISPNYQMLDSTSILPRLQIDTVDKSAGFISGRLQVCLRPQPGSLADFPLAPDSICIQDFKFHAEITK